MEPEGSLPCSQGPSTGPHPEPEASYKKNTCSILLYFMEHCHRKL